MKKIVLLVFLTLFVHNSYAQFIITWETTQNNNSIIIPTNPDFTYDYDINWGDGTTTTNQTGNAQHSYTNNGIYTVSITGNFPAIFFNGNGPFDPTLNSNRSRIKTVEQWGANTWLSMKSAFAGCPNLTITATDIPNLSQVTDMAFMFFNTPNLTVDASLWNVNSVTQMQSLFEQADDFNSDISNWDVSNVTNMRRMFWEARSFNQDIGNWDVSNVTDMSGMFYQASIFNQDIGNWNVSSVTTMERMFNFAILFNQNIGNWDVSNVTDMSEMFEQAFEFNQNIGNWDVGNVTDMNSMFLRNPVFDQPLGNWNVSNVTDMEDMFRETVFDQDIGNWVTSSATTMAGMFWDNTNFSQDIGSWEVSNVTDMSSLFNDASLFNQDISAWNVSNVTDMSSMFRNASGFNQDIGNWDVSSVTDMSSLFNNAVVFNQNISSWNVSSVISMFGMFREADVFNQDIGSWDVSNVTDMSSMFDDAFAFDQNLGNWNIGSVNDMFDMLDNSNLSIENYDSTLIGWSSQNIMPGIFLGANNLMYCNSASARTVLTSPPNNWTISQDQLDCSSQPSINVPDPNFEQALINQNIDSDGIINGQVLQSDIIDIEFLDVSANNISDLIGIEGFLALETLFASGNNLTSLDISQNINLDGLYVGENTLTSIDVSANTNLVALVLGSNQLTSIDVSSNVLLTQLFLQNNELTAIDVANLELLAELNLSGNNLNELDLSQNSALTDIDCSDNGLFNLNVQNGNNTAIIESSFNATLNENLNCIQVDVITYSDNNWTNIDSQSFFSLDCAPNNDDCIEATSLDLGTLINGTTFGSTSSNSSPSCQEDDIVLFDVWYQFTAPNSGLVTAVATSVLNSLPINLAIYEDCNAVEPISCDSGTMALTDLIPGNTYLIQIWVGGNIQGRSVLNELDEFTLVVQDTTLSTTDLEPPVSTVKLIPNPASNQTLITSISDDISSLQVFDLTGKKVLELSQINKRNQRVDISDLSKGMYLVLVKLDNATTLTKKLLIN